MTVTPFKTETSSRGARMLRTALGPGIAAWLEDAGVVEVMLNPDGRLWVDRLAKPTHCCLTSSHDFRRTIFMAGVEGLTAHETASINC